MDNINAPMPNRSPIDYVQHMNDNQQISLGIDNLASSDTLRGQRVGLVCNPASVDSHFRHTADRLWLAPEIELVALFGPQHGFHSDVQDNMIETPHRVHPQYGIPVYSLYGDEREPTTRMLKDVDVLVIDLQDVGTRVYTYIYTMANCLRACKKSGMPVIVCDRPNPIGGNQMEGPVLQSGYESFVGQFPIALRHGMTIGELATLFNDHFDIGAKLQVVSLGGWNRSLYHDQTKQPWISPSPNLPTLDSAIVYSGTVLLEGTNLSEGRGTTHPFECIGSPWIDSLAFSHQLQNVNLPGLTVRPIEFEPTFQKYSGQACGGCHLHVTDRNLFKPVLTAITILSISKKLASKQFSWRRPPYEYEHQLQPIDILFGSDVLRQQIDDNISVSEIETSWQEDLKSFSSLRKKFLLYS